MTAAEAQELSLQHIAAVVRSDYPTMVKLSEIAGTVISLQQQMLAERFIAAHGWAVQSGPFAGMEYLHPGDISAVLPKLLGSYEAELHDAIRDVIAAGHVRSIVNIGCGEGYYAVGFARTLPQVHIVAFDSDPRARQLCQELAQKNCVADRITVEGECSINRLRELAGTGVLVFCDCEGAEKQLLDPVQAPSLRQSRIIVEMHDCYDSTISQELIGRFSPTHRISIIQTALPDPTRYDALANMSQIDQMITLCEFRPGPTPWAVMTPLS